MGKLTTAPNMPSPDDFYADFIAMHEGLEPKASEALNLRLLLLLANHIGDKEVLAEALAAAAS